MRQRVNLTLALTLSLVLGTSPLIGLASSTSRPKPITSPKSNRSLPLTSRSKRSVARPIQSPAKPGGQTTTLLPDGRLLQIGGAGPKGPIPSVTIRDPRTGETIALLDMPQPRAWHSAPMLPDGRVLIIGGIGAKGRIVDGAEILDPAAKTFEPLSSKHLTTRAYHTATVLTDGHVLIVGGTSDKGRTLAQAELWDAKTQTATALTSKLSFARQKHKATLLADGNVLIEGGVDGHADKAVVAELYNTRDQSFSDTALSSEQPDDSSPYVAASLPENGAADVPVDALIAFRFSKPMRAQTINGETVTLIGPAGLVAAKIIPAEAGRLAFITPNEPLQPGTSYALSSANLTDEANRPLGATAISFTTAGKQAGNDAQITINSLTDDEEWKPDASNLRGNWRSKNKKSSLPSLPPLQAEPGVTALAGQVLTLNGKPLAEVTLRIADKTALTDRTGRFLLKSLSAGHQVMRLDGRTASRPKTTYGIFKVGVNLTAGRTNVLPYTIWMPKLDMAHAVKVPSPTKRDVVVTNPQIPGLELHLPRGTVIRDMDGTTVSEISITPIPTNQPPFPLPPGIIVPVFFTIQPGGAQVIPPRARLIYPNFTNSRPGTRIDFWNYDATEKGWYVYGKGTVGPNGKQIIPDPGVVLYEFSGAMVANPNLAPAEGPPPCGGCEDGDPVDLSTGLFVYRKTDLVLSDVIPVSLTRTYRPRDGYWTFRPFGYATTHPYEIFLVGDAYPWTYIELILPDGGRVHYDRISSGTDFYDAVYESTSAPGTFYKSKIIYNGDGWDLTLKDGTVYVFPISINVNTQQEAALSGIRDQYGNKVTLVRTSYNYRNNILTKIITRNGRWIELEYDSDYRIIKAKDNVGRVVSYQYDSGGRLWKVTDPNGEITEHTYDANNQMLTIKDARGIVYLTNEYDTDGNVFRQTQADNSTYEFAYTRGVDGKIVQTDVTDPRGNVRRVTFNASGFVLTDTYAVGEPEQQTTTYERQTGTNLVSASLDPLGRRTTYTYDSLGNITSITRLAGTSEALTTSFTYEPNFNKATSVTDPLNHTTSYSYDELGNLTSVNNPLNHQSTFTYNASGQVLTVTDPLQHTVQLTYNSGDLIAITDPLNRTVTSYLDAAGRPARLTSPLGQVTQYEYDNLNQTIRGRDPLQGLTAFAYDPNGNLLSITDARNSVTSYIYDNMDRVTTRRDPLLHNETYQYDLKGSLSQVTDRKGEITGFVYDALDRLKQVTYADTSTTTYTYNSVNRLTQVVDSLSGTITYGYDDLNRRTSETTAQGSVSYTYNAAGCRTSLTVTGQPTVNYTYDNANRLTQVTQGSATVTISYDNAGRRTSLTLPNGVVTEYTYDAASQLTGLTYKNGSTVLGNLTYGYDAAGRRTTIGGSYARNGLPQAVTSGSYNPANQQGAFGSQNLSYDLNGNLQSDGTNTYTWNARDQLVSMTGPGLTASFQYDALGRRVSKTVNSSTLTYLYDGANLVQEKSAGSPSANILTGSLDEVFSRADAEGSSGPLRDGVGSTIALTDSTGTVQTQYTYEPFGKTMVSGAANGNSSQYTGRENDGTGLYYYRGRYYSPQLQRFISQDPIGSLGGINLYTYVANNPISFSDPLGLKPQQPSVEVRKRAMEKIAEATGSRLNPDWSMSPGGVSFDGAINNLRRMEFKQFFNPNPLHFGGSDWEGRIEGDWYHVTLGYPTAIKYPGFFRRPPAECYPSFVDAHRESSQPSSLQHLMDYLGSWF